MYAVLFDIDGTLLLTGGAGPLAFAEAFRDMFGVEQLSGEVAYAGRSDRAIAGDLMRAHNVPANEGNWARFRDAYLQRLPSALSRRQGQVLPGVVELLDELQRRQHSLLGLLTGNVKQGADHKLSHYGLADRFAFGGYGDAHDERCDIAAMALSEAKRALAGRNGNRDPNYAGLLSGVMVIGDTVHDISCARSIGAVAIAVLTGNTPAEQLAAAKPDLLLTDLSDPAPVLEIVLAANGVG